MSDIEKVKQLRKSTGAIAKMLSSRGFEFDADSYNNLEMQRKSLQVKNEELKSQRNINSRNIGIAKSKNEDTSESMLSVEKVNNEIVGFENKL